MFTLLKNEDKKQAFLSFKEQRQKKDKEGFLYSHMTMVSKNMPPNLKEDNYLLSLHIIIIDIIDKNTFGSYYYSII